jgi:hypothetical protein
MTGPLVTRHGGAVPPFTRRATVDPALTLAREIEEANAANARLLDRATDAYERLPEWARGYPKIAVDHPLFVGLPRPESVKGHPWQAMREDWESYFRGIENSTPPGPMREAMQRKNLDRLAVIDAEQTRIEAEHVRVGYPQAQAESDAMGEHAAELEKRLAATAATTLHGVIAKLKIAMQYASIEDIEDRLTMSALSDAERLAGTSP